MSTVPQLLVTAQADDLRTERKFTGPDVMSWQL